MTLLVLSVIEQSVPSHIRSRGAEYAHDGAVKLLRRRSPLSALVSGSEDYLVTLRYQDRALWVGCTCPYYNDEIDVCKYIWATLLECASKKIGFPGPVDDLLIDDQAVNPFEDDDEYYVEPSRWRSQLSSLVPYAYQAAESTRIPSELIWVLDPATSGTTLSIEISSRSQKKNGQLGKPQMLRLPCSAVARLANASDREILSILASHSYGTLDPRQSIAWPAADYLVPKLVESGRLWIRSGKGAYETSVAFDAGEPWRLAVRAEERGGKYLLTGVLRRGEDSIPVREPLAITSGGFVIFRDSIARFDDDKTHAWATLLRRDKVEIPAAELDAFIKAVATSTSPLSIELPDAVTWQERHVAPRATLEIRYGTWDSTANAVPTFDYDGITINAFVRGHALYDDATKSLVVRDAAAESRCLDALLGQGFTKYGESLSIARARLGNAIPKLIEAGWEVRDSEGTYAPAAPPDRAAQGRVVRPPRRRDARHDPPRVARAARALPRDRLRGTCGGAALPPQPGRAARRAPGHAARRRLRRRLRSGPAESSRHDG